MTILLVFAAILPSLIVLAGLFYLKRSSINYIEDVKQQLRDFYTSPGEGKPSQFEVIVDEISQRLASRIMQSARLQLQNMASIDSRQNSKLEAEALQSGLPAGLSAIPGIGRMIQKNPIVGLAAQYLVGKMGGGQTAPTPGPASAPSNGRDPFAI